MDKTDWIVVLIWSICLALVALKRKKTLNNRTYALISTSLRLTITTCFFNLLSTKFLLELVAVTTKFLKYTLTTYLIPSFHSCLSIFWGNIDWWIDCFPEEPIYDLIKIYTDVSTIIRHTGAQTNNTSLIKALILCSFLILVIINRMERLNNGIRILVSIFLSLVIFEFCFQLYFRESFDVYFFESVKFFIKNLIIFARFSMYLIANLPVNLENFLGDIGWFSRLPLNEILYEPIRITRKIIIIMPDKLHDMYLILHSEINKNWNSTLTLVAVSILTTVIRWIRPKK